METRDRIREKLKLLPEKPGVYLMKDSSGQVIYVGKAKILKNRVRSYFTGSHDSKTQSLVSRIADFEYIITDTVVEALLLECNLIKQYTPHYNILLKDDKAYPYIKITHEEHPRLEIVRRVQKDRGRYFGPYPNATAAKETKRLLDRLFPLRKCRNLKKRVCLYYHINQCLAPCEFPVSPDTYEEMVKQITKFLNGGHEEIKEQLRLKMEQEAEALRFERAKELRDLIAQIDRLMEDQKVVLNDGVDRDIIAYWADKGMMCVQIFYMRKGKLIERNGAIFPYYHDEEEDFLSYVAQFYFENPDHPREILLPAGIDVEALDQWLQGKIRQPQRGDKKNLLELAKENARNALQERFQLMSRDLDRTIRAVEQLGEILAIETPHRIEAFDNSNVQGFHPVAAMVVFQDGQPARKEYRKYKIKTVTGPDDYASMREVIRRRYVRLLKEKAPLPDLIVVDGGKGQIHAALDVLQNELDLHIPVCGLAKDERHRTSQLFFMDEPEPVPIEKTSQAFYLLMRIQEEVHRFAITFHRETHKKQTIRSLLDDIPGVGEKRRQALLKHFGSLDAIRQAPVEEFRKIGIGDRLAREILTFLQEK